MNKSSAKKNGAHTQWSYEFVLKEFIKESDRAAVILIAAVIDEKLTTILKSKLIPVPTSDDNFFDGVNAPISTFSSKIDLSFRLGLISAKLCRDIHLIRKIRNFFAHDIYGCNFENGMVKSRTMELYKTCGLMDVYEYFIEIKSPYIEPGTRGIFLFVTSSIIFHLNNLLEKVTPIESIEEIKNEFIYSDGKVILAVFKKALATVNAKKQG
jgi:hypothetical protein